MKKSAIIVAGGIGTRMNTVVPKQFLLLAGKPMVMHSMCAFLDAFPEIFLVLALPGDQFNFWQYLCKEYAFNAPHQLVAGGKTRFHSVQNALCVMPGEGLVAVHDAARPLVSGALIKKAFLTAELLGNCIPVIPINESVRKIVGETSIPVDRNTLRMVQTPQVFHGASLRKAYQQDFQERFTDDSMVMESTGETIHLIDGDLSNIKITNQRDIAFAEILFEKSHA